MTFWNKSSRLLFNICPVDLEIILVADTLPPSAPIAAPARDALIAFCVSGVTPGTFTPCPNACIAALASCIAPIPPFSIIRLARATPASSTAFTLSSPQVTDCESFISWGIGSSILNLVSWFCWFALLILVLASVNVDLMLIGFFLLLFGINCVRSNFSLPSFPTLYTSSRAFSTSTPKFLPFDGTYWIHFILKEISN